MVHISVLISLVFVAFSSMAFYSSISLFSFYSQKFINSIVIPFLFLFNWILPIIDISLQQKQFYMDPRLYHYQYRRPRFNNPTYSSHNVNNSMTFFVNNPYTPKNETNNPNYSRNSYEAPRPKASQNYNAVPQYGQIGYHPSSQPPRQYQPHSEHDTRQKSNSQLSNYGNNSLAFNEREIYNKQHSQFNIISLKPREVPDRIKEYPKLTLQDKDDYYYNRVQQMRMKQENGVVRNSSVPVRQVIAGKQTFKPEEGKNPNYYQYGRYFTPKMLNHADEVSHII